MLYCLSSQTAPLSPANKGLGNMVSTSCNVTLVSNTAIVLFPAYILLAHSSSGSLCLCPNCLLHKECLLPTISIKSIPSFNGAITAITLVRSLLSLGPQWSPLVSVSASWEPLQCFSFVYCFLVFLFLFLSATCGYT